MLTVASLMVEAALAREESRGVHLRTDFPQTDDATLAAAFRRRVAAAHRATFFAENLPVSAEPAARSPTVSRV